MLFLQKIKTKDVNNITEENLIGAPENAFRLFVCCVFVMCFRFLYVGMRWMHSIAVCNWYGAKILTLWYTCMHTCNQYTRTHLYLRICTRHILRFEFVCDRSTFYDSFFSIWCWCLVATFQIDPSNDKHHQLYVRRRIISNEFATLAIWLLFCAFVSHMKNAIQSNDLKNVEFWLPFDCNDTKMALKAENWISKHLKYGKLYGSLSNKCNFKYLISNIIAWWIFLERKMA